MHRRFLAALIITAGLGAGSSQPARAEARQASLVSRAGGVVQSDVEGLLSRQSLGILAVGGALTALGHQVENANTEARFLDNPGLDGACDAGNLYGNGLTIAGGALALMAAGELGHRPRLLTAGIDVAHSFLLSGALIVAIKTAAGRTRPNGGSHSFPSGHTGVAMSAAPVLAYHFGPVVGTAAYAMAGITALGRMEDRFHYLSDVLFGATVGWAVGRTVVGEHESPSILGHLRLEPSGAALAWSF